MLPLSLSPLVNPRGLILIESSTFHTKYANCFHPKPKQNNWFCLALAHTCPRQHLLSKNDSNMASWFTDHDCGPWLCTVQGSDLLVPVGFFLYSRQFINVDCISEQLRAVSNQVSPRSLKFGCRISKVLEIKPEEGRPRNWMLSKNQLVKVEARTKRMQNASSNCYILMSTNRSERWSQMERCNTIHPTADILDDEDPYFGDIPGPETQQCLCIGCLNINNLSPYAQSLGPEVYSTEGKDKQICGTVQDPHINILLMQELGVNWLRVGSEHQWKSRVSKFLDPNHT